MSATMTAAPFTFDRDYDNREQVRPYMAEYMAVYNELAAAGLYPYNDAFRGRIASLAGTDSKNEDTAIYLLQRLRALEELAVTVADFGGRWITAGGMTEGQVLRGDIAHVGFYTGGTGFHVYERARLMMSGGRLYAIPARRQHGQALHGKVLIRDA